MTPWARNLKALAAFYIVLLWCTSAMASVQVMDVGAVCNGVADDTAAIQAAIDSMVRAGGGEVIIPGAHVCRVDGSLVLTSPVLGFGANVRLRGEAQGNGLFKPNRASSTLLFTGTAGPANTPCSDGPGSGAIQIVSDRTHVGHFVEIDHLALRYNNPGLGCLINASHPQGQGGDPVFNVHDNLLQGEKASLAPGQVTAAIHVSRAICDVIEHNDFWNFATFIEAGPGYWDSFVIKKNLFVKLLNTNSFAINFGLSAPIGMDISNNTFEWGPNGIGGTGPMQGTIIGNWFGDAATTGGSWVSGPMRGTVISGNFFAQTFDQISTTGYQVIEGNAFASYGGHAIVAGGTTVVKGNFFSPSQTTGAAGVGIRYGNIDIAANFFTRGRGGSYTIAPQVTGLLSYHSGGDFTDEKLLNNSKTVAVIYDGAMINSCKADVFLKNGQGVFSGSCVRVTSACQAVDITIPDNRCILSAPAQGYLTVSGVAGDTCRTWCE